MHLPIERLSLRGCQELGSKQVRSLLRQLVQRKCQNILTVDIRDTPAVTKDVNDIPRIISLANHAGIMLEIH